MSYESVSVAEFLNLAKESDLERTFAGQVRDYGLPEPVRQYEFHNGRRWRLDFAWPDLKIAIEVEGGIYGEEKSGHTTGAAYERNCEKYNMLTLNGWKLLRGGPKMVRGGALIVTLAELIRKETLE